MVFMLCQASSMPLVLLISAVSMMVQQAVAIECPDLYNAYGTSCLHFVHWKANQKKASKACREKMNGFLAEPRTEQLQNDLKQCILTERQNKAKFWNWGSHYVWLGATRSCRTIPGPFLWETNGDRLNYTDWSQGEPDDRWDISDCVVYLVERSGMDRGWSDSSCRYFERYQFVCQTHPVASNTTTTTTTAAPDASASIAQASGSSQPLRRSSLVALLTGTVLTWAVGRVASGHV